MDSYGYESPNRTIQRAKRTSRVAMMSPPSWPLVAFVSNEQMIVPGAEVGDAPERILTEL